MSEQVRDRDTRIFLRPIGNPLPMGFVGLAGATTMLSGLQLGWLPVIDSSQVGLVIVLVAVPLQIIASIMGYLARDPVAATGVGTLAVSWLTIGVLTMLGPAGSRSKVLGLVLFYLAAAVLVSAVIAAFGKVIAAVVLALTSARYVFTGVYQYFGGMTWSHISAWIGVALAAVAIYAVAALELESLLHRTVLPTLRRGSGLVAISGRGMEPVGDPVHEAGVRDQL
ncbi:MAG TPA: hypothetical protein VFL99_02255 [Segeticoccus sp.]|uniref:hypothetical protein n=1 Tax=Segeticoccus sp. TaxID=2706531 RepID=UPI002D7F429E|nr:hypothetical protein [Segeticoccus sp.]HET8599120.1 hypothetical protein [Segeticoccus sp.]